MLLRVLGPKPSASASFATSALTYFSFFKNSLPVPDFKYFSLCLAETRSENSSVYINLKGLYARVVLSLPRLCWTILFSTLNAKPT